MDYIVDLTVRTKDYKVVDKLESITPQRAISILIIKYSVRWNNKIQAFHCKEINFEQKGKRYG
jgi:hypothetical protein